MHAGRGPDPASARLPSNAAPPASGRFGNDFFKSPHWLVREGFWAKIPPAKKAVFIVLADHANYLTGVTWVTVKTIAQEAGVSEDAVSEATGWLARYGLIKKWRHGMRCHYHVCPSGSFAPEPQPAPEEGDGKCRPRVGTYPMPATPAPVAAPPQSRSDGLPRSANYPAPERRKAETPFRDSKKKPPRIIDLNDPETREFVQNMLREDGLDKTLSRLARTFSNNRDELAQQLAELRSG